MIKFTGLIVEQTDTQGKVTITYGKSQKGLLREHRKGKCWFLCGFCQDEAFNGANYHLGKRRSS